jgi:hypothetical protein
MEIGSKSLLYDGPLKPLADNRLEALVLDEPPTGAIETATRAPHSTSTFTLALHTIVLKRW